MPSKRRDLLLWGAPFCVSIARVSSSEREQFTVILESIETQIKVLADGHLSLNEKFDRVDNKVDRLDDRLVRVEDRLTGVENKVNRLDNKVSRLDNNVAKLDGKVARLDKKVDRVSSDMSVLRTDLGSVKRRVEKIEHHIGLNGVSKAHTMEPTTRTPARRKRK